MKTCTNSGLEPGPFEPQLQILVEIAGNIFSMAVAIIESENIDILDNALLAHRNRSDFCDLRLRFPSRTPEIAAISETRESNAALRFKGAMESR